jgi:hypothetical protein
MAGSTTRSDKQEAQELIESVRDDATWDDIVDAMTDRIVQSRDGALPPWLEYRERVRAAERGGETALLSEPALADWNTADEERAWRHLQ